MTHTIYHIVGIKVGCTKNPQRRFRENARKYDKPCEILEVLEGCDDEYAGDVEWKWAKKLGYKRNNHYNYTGEWIGSDASRTLGGQKGGKRVNELGLSGYKTGAAGRIGGKIGGRRTVELGKGTFGNPNERIKAASLGGKRLAELGLAGFQQKVTCPHCGKQGQLAGMKRWHFENCKEQHDDKRQDHQG